MKVSASAVAVVSMLAAPAVNASLIEVTTGCSIDIFHGAHGLNEGECVDENEALFSCLPTKSAMCCVENAAFATEWADCDSIGSYCTEAAACGTNECDSEIAALSACAAEGNTNCTGGCVSDDTKGVAAQFTAYLRGMRGIAV
mmetsp:Transcript_16019/g.28955  ORF Transcript_16019/g.28955 Transcript_16019/m.28955 type:complete len:143 (-) Transcript_16019:272-700(-)|eukprot:CAMPEP_0201636202 /NCGR_PEP_ID=MMETSP0493-20130528/8453_1 /ASSEMBLY_ACC=CAM_ASM_000838 /TAXON_ID=420259 /ORGANISM="Thalassiosira gravida, Strain GMp14c1" /LENGTH=142 /DNA_ID=CAMNT_0048108265 /DNA_START=218 /DNA_END=646 /DNA_ORIENTATION=+